MTRLQKLALKTETFEEFLDGIRKFPHHYLETTAHKQMGITQFHEYYNLIRGGLYVK